MPGRAMIQQHDVGLPHLDGLDGALAVGHLGYDLDTVGRQRSPSGRPESVAIVDEDDPQRHAPIFAVGAPPRIRDGTDARRRSRWSSFGAGFSKRSPPVPRSCARAHGRWSCATRACLPFDPQRQRPGGPGGTSIVEAEPTSLPPRARSVRSQTAEARERPAHRCRGAWAASKRASSAVPGGSSCRAHRSRSSREMGAVPGRACALRTSRRRQSSSTGAPR